MSRIDELKRLLFGPEQQALNDLSDRIEMPDRRVADLAEVLPESIEAAHAQGRLASAIRKPLAEVMTVAIREEPEAYADALFPVIGPAIRKAVAEAFKSLTQHLNQAIEHSLTPQGIRWRLEAWRAGVPFGQYLLQKTLHFRVEQAYLIHADSGLLIAHVADESIQFKDRDAVSAMFTALQEFIKDAFLGGENKDLETAEIGDLTVWAVHGPETILAAVIRGTPPRALRAELREILESIEGRYRQSIARFSGDPAELAAIKAPLRRWLKSSRPPEQATGTSMRFSPVRIIGAAAVLLAALWLAYAYRQSADARRLADSFESTPGIVLTGVERHRGHFTVRGFRDPIAEPIATIVGRTNIAAERVTAALTPFVSLDPAIVEARARLVLQPPETITIRMAGEVLNISGSADPDWLSRARDRASLVPGLEASLFDVSIEAPGEPRQSEPDPGAELRALAASLNGATIRFGVNDAAIAGTDPIVRELAAGLDELDRLADKLGVGTELRIAGFSDATGTAEANARVRLLRAQRFAALLTSYAERKPDLVIEQPDPSAASAERKAVLSVMIRGDAMGD